MKFFGIITLSAAALSTFVNCAPASGSGDSSKLVTSPMFWVGTPVEGGPEVRLNGTAKEILEQILEINPDWKEAPVPTKTSADETPSVVKRYFQGRPTCDRVVGSWAKDTPIFEEVIPYLYRLGSTQCGAYARSCSRVSCAWNSGVELCNDRTTEVRMNCDRIAHAANEIRKDCHKMGGPDVLTYIVKGQWFDTTGYNVIIRGHNC